MFNRKECKHCNKKVSGKYDFCPYCGRSVIGKSKKKDDFGMLGEDDNIDEFERLSKSMFDGFGGKIMNKMLGSAMKMLEKELEKEMKQKKNIHPRTNFQLFINGKRVNLNGAAMQQSAKQKDKKQTKEVILNYFSQEAQKKFSNLPRKEPSTDIRRLSDKVVYEINLPGVNSMKDISLMKLENSLEIKAVGKNKAYFKTIPINLPIINNNFADEKLVLEFGFNTE